MMHFSLMFLYQYHLIIFFFCLVMLLLLSTLLLSEDAVPSYVGQRSFGCLDPLFFLTSLGFSISPCHYSPLVSTVADLLCIEDFRKVQVSSIKHGAK